MTSPLRVHELLNSGFVVSVAAISFLAIGRLAMQNERVIVLEQQTWVTLAGLVLTLGGFTATIVGVLHGMKRELKDDIEQVHTELKSEIVQTNERIDSLRTELKSEIVQTNERIDSLRTELRSEIVQTNERIDSLRTELKFEIGEVRADIRFLTQRTFDILVHPPTSAASREAD